MKKIINGKLYDTETAKEIDVISHGDGPRDFNYFCETLYRKRTGEYFIHGKGGPMSRYAEASGQNTWSGGEKIIPLEYKAAAKWGEENMTAEDYQREFGEVSEGEERTVLSISLDTATADRIRRIATMNSTSVSALVASRFALCSEVGDTMTESDLVAFVEEDLCEGNKLNNAVCYSKECHEKEQDIQVVFNKDHRRLYGRLLEFCGKHGGLIIETHPGTLATIVRVKREA